MELKSERVKAPYLLTTYYYYYSHDPNSSGVQIIVASGTFLEN